MPVNVVVLGPPGAGKGTQTARLAVKKGLVRVATGDILREAVKRKTALGLAAGRLIDQGQLVDNETMIGIVKERISRPDVEAGFLLDGFPRTVAQAIALDGLIVEAKLGPLVVLNINVPVDELVRRLLERKVCKACGNNATPGDTLSVCRACGGGLVRRSDDIDSVVRNRLEVFGQQTKPLVEFYQSRSAYFQVDGAQDAELVTTALEAALELAIERRGQLA
jgi:adenylate kinase